MRSMQLSRSGAGMLAGVRGYPAVAPLPPHSDPTRPGGASRPTRSSAPDDATRQSRAARSALGERLESECGGSDAPCPCPCARRGRGAGVVGGRGRGRWPARLRLGAQPVGLGELVSDPLGGRERGGYGALHGTGRVRWRAPARRVGVQGVRGAGIGRVREDARG